MSLPTLVDHCNGEGYGVNLERERLERCLERVVACKAAGLKARAWVAANGVELRELQSWCAHSKR